PGTSLYLMRWGVLAAGHLRRAGTTLYLMSQGPLEGAGLGGLLFDEHRAVLRTQRADGQQRRAGIEPGLAAFAAQAIHCRGVIAKLLGIKRLRGLGEPPDAGSGFAARAAEVIRTAAGVRLQI